MKLYEAGALNKRVMDKATLVEQNTYIPSHKEIDKYENDTVPIPVAKPKNPHVDEPALMLMKLWEGLINILELLILEWYGYTLI